MEQIFCQCGEKILPKRLRAVRVKKISPLSGYTPILATCCAMKSTGSHESTFSFRIREDRQMMGFSKESTFNNLCGSRKDSDENDPHSCEKPSYWRIEDSVRKELEREEQGHEQTHEEL